jgi:hypothetical protein
VPKLSGITAVDNAVPARVIGELRTQITHAEAARDARTHWYSLEAPPRHLIEQVIQHLRRFVPSGFVGAEWWFRATTPDTEFPFHFDRDEAIRRSIVSPGLATILYLSSAGGPTVILNATPSRVSAPTCGPRGSPAARSVRDVSGRAAARRVARATEPVAAHHAARQLVASRAADGARRAVAATRGAAVACRACARRRARAHRASPVALERGVARRDLQPDQLPVTCGAARDGKASRQRCQT